MKQGILWFDDDPKADLSLKVNRALEYVQQKYGLHPRLCFVHPSLVKKRIFLKNGLEIRANRTILPNHFWLELMN
jgi:hypothetical protein